MTITIQHFKVKSNGELFFAQGRLTVSSGIIGETPVYCTHLQTESHRSERLAIEGFHMMVAHSVSELSKNKIINLNSI